VFNADELSQQLCWLKTEMLSFCTEQASYMGCGTPLSWLDNIYSRPFLAGDFDP